MSPPGPAGPGFSVAVGNITPSSATILVRGDDTGERLEGHLIGPWCRIAHTLPRRIPLEPLAGQPSRAVARVVDPCFWSPRLPAYYRLIVRRAGTPAGEPAEQWVGIRHLAARREGLYFEGRRWVVRGLWGEGVSKEQLDDMQRLGLTWITPQWDAARLAEASLAGTPVVIDASNASPVPNASPDPMAALLGEIARWPAVIAVLGPPTLAAPDLTRQSAPNLLVGIVQEGPEPPPAWALHPQRGAILVTPEDLLQRRDACGAGAPRLRWAVADGPAGADPAAWRGACERLQARLAPQWDLAGYIVRQRPPVRGARPEG